MSVHPSRVPRIRDPFIVTDPGSGRYLLFGTTDRDPWTGPGTGFDCYVSDDLATWKGPIEAFRPGADFWATTQFWAPEVYQLGDCWVMIATFSDGSNRGCQVLASEAATGPYVPWSGGPVTPSGWSTLDGTLWLEDDGTVWLIFCHEWTQVGDGRICAMPLAPDLREAAGPPETLFVASDAPWTDPVESGAAWVTDGPYPFRAPDGTLCLLWSSFSGGSYAMGVARSASGLLSGPWVHDEVPLAHPDGGHGMVFTDLGGASRLSWHTPNDSPAERSTTAAFPLAAPGSSFGESHGRRIRLGLAQP